MNLIKGFLTKYMLYILGSVIVCLCSYIGYLEISIYYKNNKITNLNATITDITLQKERLTFELEQANLSIDGQNKAIETLALQTKELDEKLNAANKVNELLDEQLQNKLKEKAPEGAKEALNWLREQAGKL